MTMNDKQKALCEDHDYDFSDMSALFLNRTLKPSGTKSHTEALMSVAQAIMESNGVATQMLRPMDIDLPPGARL